MGHTSGRITTHYSSAELQDLYNAANKVCEKRQNGVVLTLLRNLNAHDISEEKQDSKAEKLPPCDPSSRKNHAEHFLGESEMRLKAPN